MGNSYLEWVVKNPVMHDLENALNDLAQDGYTVFKIDISVNGNTVVACRKKESDEGCCGGRCGCR